MTEGRGKREVGRALAVMGLSLALVACGEKSLAPRALTLQLVNAEPVMMTAGSQGDSVRVLVLDGSATPQPGVTVNFRVATGSGRVSAATAVTGATGRAAVLFVPDTRVGTSTITVSAENGSSSFAVTTVAAVAATLSFSRSILVVDSGSTTPIQLTAVDPFGNTVPLSAIPLIVRTTGVVDASGGSYAARVPGQAVVLAASGAVSDSQLVVVARPGGPLVSTDLPQLGLRIDTTLNLNVTVDMRGSTQRVGSMVLRITWNPAVLTYVSDAEVTPGSGVVVNATSATQGTLTLALANSDGFAGTIVLRRVTFRAGPTAGRGGSLTLTTSEISSSQTFADLLPRTVSVSYPIFTR
jgi:hypothetical protein